jgi:serine/threonine protein kinase
MLRIDPEKRPSCQELIDSALFKHYSNKLVNLDSVDKTFTETIDQQSPPRTELNQITSQLLKTIAYPKSLELLS